MQKRLLKLILHPVLKGPIEILELQQSVPPFGFGPRPDGFDGIEVRRARRQESWSGSTIGQDLLNLITPMSPMVVHHNHFVEELMIPVILLVEILDCFDIGRVSN